MSSPSGGEVLLLDIEPFIYQMTSIKSKSKSHHSSVKLNVPISKELDIKITQKYGLPQSLSPKNYELFHIEIEKTCENILGIQLNDSCVVSSVNRDDVDVIFGDLWLELNDIWLEDKNHFSYIFRKMKREANGSLKLKLKIARLLWKQNLPDDRMPVDMLPRRDYKYHLALIYGIPGMHLTLALKALNGKVFVSGVSEETLGRMAFSVGDAILDVDHCMISSIAPAYEEIKQKLKTHGVVSCVVERADSKTANYNVLEAIRSEKNPHKEERLNKDVEKICRKQKRKPLREMILKSIVRGKDSKSYQSSHVTFKPAHDVVHINADINPILLQPVPSHNVLPADTLLAPGRSAESILSEISSEATTEEGHQEQKQSKTRPMRQKDCRLTTGTKVIKQKRSTKPGPSSPVASTTTTAPSAATSGKKPPSTPNDSPRETKESDSEKRTIRAATPTIAKTQNDSAGKRNTTTTTTTTKTTQNTDSGKRTLTTVKTQTDSNRRFTVSKTQSKTPQDTTDSRKKTISTVSSDPKKRCITPRIRTTASNSKDTSPKNSLKNNSNSQRQ